MSHEFDVSLMYSEPVSPETVARQKADVDNWTRMPSALSNAKLHAQRELEALVGACNRLAWGYGPVIERIPSTEEAAALLEALGAEKSEKLMTQCRLVNETRNLILLIKEGEAHSAELLRKDEAERAQQEAWRRELEEFEAYDTAGKQARFDAWRAQRA